MKDRIQNLVVRSQNEDKKTGKTEFRIRKNYFNMSFPLVGNLSEKAYDREKEGFRLVRNDRHNILNSGF